MVSDRHVFAAPPPTLAPPVPPLSAPHELFVLTCLVLKWPHVLCDGGPTASRPSRPPSLLSDQMDVVHYRALLFLSAAATTWCGRAEQEEAPGEGLDVEMRSSLETRASTFCFPVWGVTFYAGVKKQTSSKIKQKTYILSTHPFHHLF